MVWRIHFTAEDLERIQVRPTLGPLSETVKAMYLLRCTAQSRASYRQWRSRVKDRLTPQMTALTALIPPGSSGVDLPMLTGAAPTLEQGVQALLAVPASISWWRWSSPTGSISCPPRYGRSVLRDAGLIITHRQGSAVLHVLTPLGAELLHVG